MPADWSSGFRTRCRPVGVSPWCGSREGRVGPSNQGCSPRSQPVDRRTQMTKVMIGVDPHKGSHTATMLDRAERELKRITVRSGRRQVEQLLEWADGAGPRTWAVESAGGMGYLLSQQLVAAGETVFARERRWTLISADFRFGHGPILLTLDTASDDATHRRLRRQPRSRAGTLAGVDPGRPCGASRRARTGGPVGLDPDESGQGGCQISTRHTIPDHIGLDENSWLCLAINRSTSDGPDRGVFDGNDLAA
jgi:hypothetical protein